MLNFRFRDCAFCEEEDDDDEYDDDDVLNRLLTLGFNADLSEAWYWLINTHTHTTIIK